MCRYLCSPLLLLLLTFSLSFNSYADETIEITDTSHGPLCINPTPENEAPPTVAYILGNMHDLDREIASSFVNRLFLTLYEKKINFCIAHASEENMNKILAMPRLISLIYVGHGEFGDLSESDIPIHTSALFKAFEDREVEPQRSLKTPEAAAKFTIKPSQLKSNENIRLMLLIACQTAKKIESWQNIAPNATIISSYNDIDQRDGVSVLIEYFKYFEEFVLLPPKEDAQRVFSIESLTLKEIQVKPFLAPNLRDFGMIKQNEPLIRDKFFFQK